MSVDSSKGYPNGGNPQLNFLLAAYQDPATMPGVVADNTTALRTIGELTKVAVGEVRRARIRSGTVADDSVSILMEEVANSNILTNFRPQIGGFRGYVNSWLRRIVWKQLAEERGNRTIHFDVQMACDKSDPTKDVEIADLEGRCVEVLDVELRPSVAPSGSTKYVRIHRWRNKQWARISHLFPDMRLRASRRRLRRRR